MRVMAALLFEIGRYIAFLGVFFFVTFGISLWLFRGALDRKGLSIEEPGDPEDGATSIGSVRLGETVHYLRRRDYVSGGTELQKVGDTFRAPIVWTFYLGVWCFCLGLFLLSVTFGFVLLP